MSICDGKGGVSGEHCCYFDGIVCKYYDNGCSLRRELGSWEKVHNDPRYIKDITSKKASPIPCGDFPTSEMIELVKQGKRDPTSICCYSKLFDKD